MHRIHNIYVKSLNDRKLCDKYIEDLFTCYVKDYTIEKEKIIDAECKVAPEAISILNDAAKTKRGKVTVSEPKEESK